MSQAASPAGYSQYFIPGAEDNLLIFHNAVNNTAFTTTHSVITAVAWSPNTVIYYDHWENGYTFDPTNPEKEVGGIKQYDEKITLATRGESYTFESAAIPAAPRNPANIYYDGKDRIWAVGGALAVNRVTWPEDAGTVEAIGIEVYPVRPQLTTYIMPVGENLAYGVGANPDFERVFAFVQATEDGTSVQFDLNADGVLGDSVCTSRDWPCTTTATQVTLNAGESFLLDRYSSSPTTGDPTTAATPRLNVGTMIQGTETLQVNYLFCDVGSNYNSRGISAFPTGLWDRNYYTPVGTDAGANAPTDIYIYNPHDTALTVNYSSITASGSLSVPPNSTVSYYVATGTYATQNSATFLQANDVFWGFYSVDRTGQAYDWSDSLIPSKLLTDEYFIGWAPGAYPPAAGAYADDSGIFITAAQDYVRVYIDTNSDGVPDQTYDLSRLQSQYVWDPADGDMSGTNIWATGPITMTYGQNPDYAITTNPAIDTGAAIVPGIEFTDLVLSVDKATNPVVVATASGAQATYALTVKSAKYTVDGVSVVDTLPAGWAYVDGTTSITLADKTTSTANPVLSGSGNRTLTWSGLGNMAEQQQITIVFTVQTTQDFTTSDITRNFVEATGTRTIGNPQVTQIFTASDFVFNSYSETSSQLSVTKSTGGVDPLTPGDVFTYTVAVTNDGTSDITNVSMYDPLPDGLSYVAGSSEVTGERSNNVRDEFSSTAYNLNAGSQPWSGGWSETDSLGSGATGGLVSVAAGRLQFAYAAALNNVRDEFSTVSYANNNGTNAWAGDWTETDGQGTVAGPGAGFVLVTGGALQLRYQTANTADNFGAVSYSNNDGSNNWTTAWSETGDDGLSGSGSIYVKTPQSYLVFESGAPGRAITRSVPVIGPSATISFTLGDRGIDAGEGVIAQYSLNGGATWTEIQRIDDKTLTGTNPLTISTAGAATITLRFVTFGTYTGNDAAEVDNVDITFDNAVGAQVLRTANTSGQTSATLSFTFNSANLETTDTMVVEAGSSPAGPFTTLATYNSATAAGAKTFNISSYISPATTIRYRVSGGLNAPDEYFSLDNIDITYAGTYYPASGSLISRQADLTGAAIATLSFDFSSAGLEAGDTMALEINGGAGFTTLAAFDSTTADGSKTYDISSYASSATSISFSVTGGVNDTGEYFGIDNVDISYISPIAAAAGNPPNFITAEDAYSLRPGQSLILTYNVAVNSPLATGITSITNNACATADGFFVAVCDDVTNIAINPTAGSAKVGDRVWFDVNGDGVQDVGEAGFANVEVTLKDKYGSAVAVTITGGNGAYLFEGVLPDTGYYVQVTGGLPAGLVQSFPTGRTDDKTDAFPLTAGQLYLNADLGYTAQPANALIGDYVWHDADGDRVQDAGEPGLSGIAVVLWQDNGDGVFQGAGTDTQVATQLTGADGRYLFSVATPGGATYFTTADATQAALTGYTATTNLVTTIPGLTSGTSSLVNDFGFRNTTSTYSIRDRVWFDPDTDGNDDVAANDSSETGIGGVTVDLLNASRVVIATTTTDASGYFLFTGLPGAGADYTIRVTDSNGKLNDFYGTTTPAIAREWPVNNLSASLDYAVEPSEPHFGYNVKGAIGDTVFSDTNGNGLQDAGEFGISGVTVALYQDSNGNGLLDTGEPLSKSLVTDSSGYYIFSGLSNGTYIVSIPTPPAGYTYTMESPDNDPATGDQQPSTISGDSSDLARDFGYQVPPAVQRSISGTVWEDANLDGAITTGETGLAGITVQLLDSGGTVVSSTITNASGYYEFTGLQAGVYTARLTDQSGILTDYATTFEVTEGTSAGTYNGLEAIDLSAESAVNINFGYINPRSTRAVIAEFDAFNDQGKVVVRWQTLSEQGTIGFYLYRLNKKSGAYKKINHKLLPGLLHAPAGGRYSYEDTGAQIDQYYTYRLEEVEVGGNRISYGPWTVYTGTQLAPEEALTSMKANAYVQGFKQAATPLFQKSLQRLEVRAETRLQAQSAMDARTGSQAKITITEEGLYFVSADDISQTLGKSLSEITQLIQSDEIRLSNKGLSVAVMPAPDASGVYFYGEGFSTSYTNENVYWLDIGAAATMTTVARPPLTPPADAQYVRHTVRDEKSQYALVTLFRDPKADFWMGDYIFPGFGRDTVSATIATPGVIDRGETILTVAFQGASEDFDGDDHHAVISVNGHVVGDVRFDGLNESIVSCTVDTNILYDGQNSIEISGIQEPGVSFDIFYINYCTIEYPRQNRAVDNYFAFTASSAYDLLLTNCGGCGLPACEDTVVIDGFTNPDIKVFDITDPLSPKIVTGVTSTPPADDEPCGGCGLPPCTASSGYLVSFRIDVQSGSYLAVTPDAVKTCSLVADQPSSLKDTSSQGDYLIITTGPLLEAAQELADYRNTSGYTTRVIDIEDIYDEFAHGLRDAEAIRAFLQHAYTLWSIPPKYVVLAGEGSFDYNDFNGFSDCLIPPLLAATPEGLIVTDTLYADMAGDDGVPEIAIGRIPAISADELSDYTAKIMGYESSAGQWATQALFAADAPDAGGDFRASSEEIAGLLPQSFTLDRIYLGTVPQDETWTTMSADEARAAFLAGINEGRAYVNYIGHGGLTLIGNTNLFSTGQLAQLVNGERLPVVTAMTCMAGNYGYPGFDSLSEAIVLKSYGGAVAMWSPSGDAYNHYSMVLCKNFYTAVFADGKKTLGDAILSAQKSFAESGENLYHLELYNLIGDPALVMK